MKFRKLRTTWSVFWAVLALLVCAMWVRSITWADAVTGPFVTSEDVIIVRSLPGVVDINHQPGTSPPPWSKITDDARQIWDDIQNADPAARPYESRFWGMFHVDLSWPAITFPYWFAVLTTALVATLPWLRLRFSLRTLLIATTIIAVALGIVVWSS